jgi:hypothetical protein
MKSKLLESHICLLAGLSLGEVDLEPEKLNARINSPINHKPDKDKNRLRSGFLELQRIQPRPLVFGGLDCLTEKYNCVERLSK